MWRFHETVTFFCLFFTFDKKVRCWRSGYPENKKRVPNMSFRVGYPARLQYPYKKHLPRAFRVRGEGSLSLLRATLYLCRQQWGGTNPMYRFAMRVFVLDCLPAPPRCCPLPIIVECGNCSNCIFLKKKTRK